MDKIKIDNLPSILDKEISKPSEDKFGHMHFAEILFSYIKNHTPPFSIGLLGDFGVGKSSIKTLCKEKFLIPNKKDYEIIDFNAWRYESKDIRRSFLKHLYEKLTNTTSQELKDKFHNPIIEIFKQPKTIRATITEIYDKYFWSTVQMFAIFIFIFTLMFTLIGYFHINNEWAKVIITTIFGAYATSCLKYIFSANGFILSRYANKTRFSLPIINSEQYEEELITAVKTFNEKNKNKKIIVFVDDLDRLTSEKMIEGLDAIWIKDIIGEDAGTIINSKTLKNTQPNYNKLITQLSGIFKANTFLTNQMKKINKSKKK